MDKKTGIQTVSFLAVLFLLFGTGYAAPKVQKVGVESAAGQVEWLQAGKSDWRPLKGGGKLSNGDKVRTGSGSGAVLAFPDSSVVTLGPDSEFAIQTSVRDGQRTESTTGITAGEASVTVGAVSAGSNVELQTPLAAVRVPAGSQNISYRVTIGSVLVETFTGPVEVVRDAAPGIRATLESGEQLLLEFDDTAGALTVTSLAGTIVVIGPDGVPVTLGPGDSVVFQGGAATFIPVDPGIDAPVGDALSEPHS